ncbi:MAG: hypothetical protein QF886_11610, partial [Planctomycetota bacterium]|nr:hypothetical protein [Planctomycetota bacterium]
MRLHDFDRIRRRVYLNDVAPDSNATSCFLTVPLSVREANPELADLEGLEVNEQRDFRAETFNMGKSVELAEQCLAG